MDLSKLAAEFPRQNVHWRAQSLTQDKKKAQALAYLDARDVMDRLDEVCGPDGWQTKVIETARGRVVCSIGIRCGDEWIWKTDGAGDTAVEGEKGGISDSLKRAAVQWGVGRYLYRLSATWVPCEVGQNGKWRKWAADPWAFVRQGPYQSTLIGDDDDSGEGTNRPPPKQSEPNRSRTGAGSERDGISDTALNHALSKIGAAMTLADLKTTWLAFADAVRADSDVLAAKDARKADLEAE